MVQKKQGKKINYFFFICISLFAFSSLFSQNPEVDSLLKKLSLAKEDTNKANILYQLSEVCDEKDIVKFGTELLTLSEKLNFNEGIAGAANNLGYAYHLSQPEKALQYYFRALNTRKVMKDTIGMATIFNNIGAVYQGQGNISKALEYHYKSLKIQEQIGDKEGLARAYHNLSLIYKGQDDIEKALEYNHLSLKIREEIGDKEGMATSLNNLGVICSNKEENDKALDYYQRALTLREEINDKKGMGTILSNLGSIYLKQNLYDKATEDLEKALKIAEELNDKQNMGFVLSNMARIYSKKNIFKKAIDYNLKALEIGKNLGHPAIIIRASQWLSYDYKNQKQFEKALFHFEIYKQLSDSINNLETKKKSMKAELQHDFDKKEAGVRAKQEIKDALAKQEKELMKTKEFWIEVVCIIIFISLASIAFIIYKRYKIKEKTSAELTVKNLIIEEKNKDITDSINYAKRIQMAILPREDEIRNSFPDSFVFYKPKDIVSGDFYWISKNKNQIFLAAVDCTGHGVPGAFMSMIGNTLLNEIVNEKKISSPDEILFHLREGIIKSLKQTGAHGGNEGGASSDTLVRDGMDIALCAFNMADNILEFSGAYNSLWIINGNNFREINGDKQPIGIYHDNSRVFTNHKIELKERDAFYIFTDGYADQFGGPKGKKFKYSKLEKLLISIKDKTMNEQRGILENTFEEWRGSLEQVDDICIIGIRV